MDIPRYLYHYTSVESLALILRNRTFRLNPLDRMDDLQEKETKDLKGLGSFCYVSSWTDDPSEQIPMWKMYTDPKAGVRIRLKTLPFKTYPLTQEHIDKYLNHISRTAIPSDIYVDFDQLVRKSYFAMNWAKSLLLKKVEYTDESSKLYPQLLQTIDNDYVISLNELGKYKNTHWEFQSEWRYSMVIIPFEFSCNENKQQIIQVMAKMMKGILKPAVSYFDLQIDEQAFADMEITLSPQITCGNELIVKTLVEKYNPKASVTTSSLLGLI